MSKRNSFGSVLLGSNGITSGGISRPVDRLVVCAVPVVPSSPFGVTESAEIAIRSPEAAPTSFEATEARRRAGPVTVIGVGVGLCARAPVGMTQSAEMQKRSVQRPQYRGLKVDEVFMALF